jgi:dihydrofolate synthase/folylpolyglutamate synthase
MLADKPVEAAVRALNDNCNRWICADSPGHRGQTAAALAARVNSARPSAEVIVAGSVHQAMQNAVRSTKEGQAILVFGSFTTVSEAAAWVQNSMQREQQLTAKIS